MSSENTVVEVRGLSKCYTIYDKPTDRLKQFVLPRARRSLGLPLQQYYKEFWALRDVSFDIKKGSAVAIIGRNGSGKSTLLQIISGTLSPTAGTVETRGRIAALLELGSGFNPEFSGRENVFLNASVLGLSLDEIKSRFDEIADFADIGEFIEQPVKTYSSGMIVRLAFAVSACIDPEILIVDEALSVGDIAFQFKCLARLDRLIQNGTTLLFVSHDMGMVKNFCQSAIYLQHGKVKAIGEPSDISEQYFLDMREEQLKAATGKAQAVAKKTFRGKENGIAFGTDEGDILNAEFVGAAAALANFTRNEIIRFKISLRFHSTITRPAVSVILQDNRNIVYGGHYFFISEYRDDGDWRHADIFASFPAALSGGRYFITLRLEQRDSPTRFVPIDKQVGILSFEIVEPEAAFIGPIDLGFEFSHQLTTSAT